MYVYIYMYVYVYIYMYVYIYIYVTLCIYFGATGASFARVKGKPLTTSHVIPNSHGNYPLVDDVSLEHCHLPGGYVRFTEGTVAFSLDMNSCRIFDGQVDAPSLGRNMAGNRCRLRPKWHLPKTPQ